ncbi:Peroxisome proliferator-activated receptor gamma coactivator-related protein 1 [Anthophora quadrimaculata]
METGFLNFHDEEHFSDFSLSLEQNLMEKPQDLLMHMVENDFDYMETHLDITNSDSLWNNEHEHNKDVEEMSISEMPTISKIDSIKEDFAKVLTDWQEHIGYLQASDMDEYMDIIGLSMNATDKRNFCTSENILPDEQPLHTLDSEFLITKQEDIGKEFFHVNQTVSDLNSSKEGIECTTEDNLHHKIEDFMGSDNKKKTEPKSLLRASKHSKNQSKLKKNIHKYDSIGIDMSANVSTKQKRKKKDKPLRCNKEIQRNDHDNNKSYTNQTPVLEAGDVKSLLEQFEASENTLLSSYPSAKVNAECELDLLVKSNEVQNCVKQSQVSNLHKNIRDALPQEVIENIKISARKKVISVIPAIPSIQSNGRSNGTRMQDAAATLFRNKLLKIVTNNTKNKIIDGGLVQLDHDYCSTNSSISSSSGSTCEKQSFSSHLNRSLIKSREYLTESNSKKDSGLESGEVSDNSEEQSGVTIVSDIQVTKTTKQLQNETKECKMETSTIQGNCHQVGISNISSCVSENQNDSSNNPTHEMKIHSALATSILQLRQGVLSKTKLIKAGNQRMKQMVSVLKKPPNVQQVPIVMTSNESVITTTNSLNDKVQNIIVQDSEKTLIQEEKKPPRKKLNLAEYRSRREQNRSDNSRTNSPLQPMTLVYVHHAFTTTEPIKDDPQNLIWSEREIVSVLKPKVDVQEEKVRLKPSTCEIGIQTYETVFEFPTKSLTDVDERREQQRDDDVQDTNQRSCKRHRINSNSSRSRSRSKSQSKSRSRSRSRSGSNRSRSRKCSNTRHRRLSHRRSSGRGLVSVQVQDIHDQVLDHLDLDLDHPPDILVALDPPLVPISEEVSGQDGEESKLENIIETMIGIGNLQQAVIIATEIGEGHQQILIVDRMTTDEGITKADLRRRFEVFGPVVDISVHFREHGDNYGFVTFAYKNDAYEAVEHGNDDPTLPRYDLCFGGRRAFCKVKYADLDGMASNSLSSGQMIQDNEDNTFDLLLKEAKAKLRKRKV